MLFLRRSSVMAVFCYLMHFVRVCSICLCIKKSADYTGICCIRFNASKYFCFRFFFKKCQDTTVLTANLHLRVQSAPNAFQQTHSLIHLQQSLNVFEGEFIQHFISYKVVFIWKCGPYPSFKLPFNGLQPILINHKAEPARQHALSIYNTFSKNSDSGFMKLYVKRNSPTPSFDTAFFDK